MPTYRIPVWHPGFEEPLVKYIHAANLGNGQWEARAQPPYGMPLSQATPYRGKREADALLALVQDIDLPPEEGDDPELDG